MALDFSIIVPAYDVAPYIGQTLASAAISAACASATTIGGAGEIVVVDDASTDGTAAVVRHFAAASPVPVRVVRLAVNGGAGAARNAGARAARGEVLFFLDGDDLYLPTHVMKCLDALDAVPCAAFVRSRVIVDVEPHPKRRASLETTIPSVLAMRRAAFHHIGGFGEGPLFRELGTMEDSHLARFARLLFLQARVTARTVFYRARPGNMRERKGALWHQPPDAEGDLSFLTPRQHALRQQIFDGYPAFWAALRSKPTPPEMTRWLRPAEGDNCWFVTRHRRL